MTGTTAGKLRAPQRKWASHIGKSAS